VLTGLSGYWFSRTKSIVPNHLLTIREDGRSMECRKLLMLPIECVVRGYLSGSGWKSYRESGEVCGIALPGGLSESDRLPEPIFTPTTKAAEGHDAPLTAEQAGALVGDERLAERERISIELYTTAAEALLEKGIVIADTKFELGLAEDGTVVLGDEIFTPDSSRFWPADEYQPGGPQPSFDKQFVRDYTEPLGWDTTPPGRAPRRRGRRHARPLRRGAFEQITRMSFDEYAGRADEGARMKATVLVRPKPGILGPQGRGRGLLRHLGFKVDSAGRAAARIEVDASDPDQARAESSGCAPSCWRTR
jgi:phosphoribosylaminoimidazole-succinocarboxamide synthase